MSLEKAVSSAYAAGCRLVFASGSELAAPEDMRVFRCADAHTAVYAALGASLAGRRVLVALGEAVELPDSRVTGGVAVLMPGAGGDFAGLREAFAASKGLCLPHYFQVMQDAPRHLSGKTLEEFSQTAMRVERENLARVEKDLEWFTLKFDYRNKDKPWGNSQDAVERAINKLRGKCVGDG